MKYEDLENNKHDTFRLIINFAKVVGNNTSHHAVRRLFSFGGYIDTFYDLRSISIGQWLAYPPRRAVELGSCVDDEAYGWAWKPYGWFDPAPRPRDIIHTYIYGRRPRLAHPVRG